MAGYNGRIANATMDNPQAIRQREAISTTSELGLSPEAIGQEAVTGLGIARSQSRLFPDFPKLDDSLSVFLETVAASSNPDFTSQFSPVTMKSFNEIKDGQEGENPDKPSIGQGPNLKVQSIDNVISGNIQSIDNVSTDIEGKRGFGWNSDKHASAKIGSYFKNKYNNESTEVRVIKGENVDTEAIVYAQDYAQNIADQED